jgi:hypothetical protein
VAHRSADPGALVAETIGGIMPSALNCEVRFIGQLAFITP